MNTFADIDLHEEILDAIGELGFETPTPIQAKTIPHLLNSQRDLVALAQTGTGKTAAFGLPAIQLTNISDKSTQTLVLCPTRELCIQITRDLTNYAKNIKGLNVLAVYGGAGIEPQIKALRKGAHIVVATPGRAKDLMKRKRLQLGNVARVILDEADEMLTMGFKDELDAILGDTPTDKQTLLFSATMSKEIMRIAQKYMHDPEEMSVANKNITAENVKHLFYMVNMRDKYEVLKRISDMNPNIYGIVFCRTRRETKEIAAKLMSDGYNADALHGDLSQAQRDEVMGRFRMRHIQILVATDVAARGIDVNDLTHIVNYNLPDDDEIYVHRSGRTGRAGKSGTSIAIIHSRETRKIKDIERRFKIKFEKELAPSGKDICNIQLIALIDKIEKVEVDNKQIEPFMPAIYEKLEWLSREDLIKHFVSAEFNRFLEYYKGSRDINIQERSKRDRNDRDRNDGDRNDRKSKSDRRQTPFTRLYINVGSKNNLTPVRLIGLINETLDSGDSVIGKIEVLKKFAFFEIEEGLSDQLLNGLKEKSFDDIALLPEISKEKPMSERRSSDGRSGGGGRRDDKRRRGGDGRRRGGNDSDKRHSDGSGRRSKRQNKY